MAKKRPRVEEEEKVEEVLWKASFPIVITKRDGEFDLRSTRKVRKGGGPGTLKYANRYTSKAAAALEGGLFQYAVYCDGVKDWDHFNITGSRYARYEAEYRTFQPPTHSMFDSNLCAAQGKKLKKIRKIDPTVTRQQLKEEVVNATPSGKERFTRHLARCLLGVTIPDKEIDARSTPDRRQQQASNKPATSQQQASNKQATKK
jgi:hypothetical protein